MREDIAKANAYLQALSTAGPHQDGRWGVGVKAFYEFLIEQNPSCEDLLLSNDIFALS